MIEWIAQPWPWYTSGILIALVMFLLLYFGKSFGMSSNLRTMCTISGAGKFSDFFRFDWKAQSWNLVFVLGTITGGFIAAQFLNANSIELSAEMLQEMKNFGIENPGEELIPSTFFSWEAAFSLRGLVMLLGGGFLVGFGARYAGGCTSGHAISGLSNLQLPSLIAVVGFFIGGLIMTYFLLPIIINI